MEKNAKRFVSFLLVFLLLFAVVAPMQADAANVKSIKLNKKTATIYVGDVLTLKATVKPASASDEALAWTTKKAHVATVDQAGLVTAVGAGKTTITVKSENGKKATCVVTVKVRVDGVAFSKSETTIKKGKSEKLAWTVSPSNASNKGVTFSSSAKSIASVDKKGKVTAKKAGTAVITVKTKDGGFADQVTVSVTGKSVAATKIELSPTSATLGVGESVSLSATISPANATDKTVSWTTSHSSVATVDADGRVKAVGIGSATITAATANGKKATCAVKVEQGITHATGVSVSPASASLSIGQTRQLSATVSPSDATDKNVQWSSSNSKIASVSANGLVTAVAAGSATITAKSSNGVSGTCAVTVSQATQSLDEMADQVIAIVNQERAKAGLPALVKNNALTAAANIRAKEIQTKFSHTRPDGSQWSSVSPLANGENIAYGQKSPAAVMVAWMNSTGHRENILRDWFQSIGVGVYRGSNGTLYWVQLFGANP